MKKREQEQKEKMFR